MGLRFTPDQRALVRRLDVSVKSDYLTLPYYDLLECYLDRPWPYLPYFTSPFFTLPFPVRNKTILFAIDRRNKFSWINKKYILDPMNSPLSEKKWNSDVPLLSVLGFSQKPVMWSFWKLENGSRKW